MRSVPKNLDGTQREDAKITRSLGPLFREQNLDCQQECQDGNCVA